MPLQPPSARLATRIVDNDSTHYWISLDDALNLLYEKTGQVFTRQYLLGLHLGDQLDIYLDCSFASACMSEHQFLAHTIKGVDYCRLLHARELFSLPEGSEPLVRGPVTVLGTAWVYSLEDKEPQLADGVWCFDFGERPRQLYVSPADIHALSRQISP